ncbi:hypothetical protein LSCM1_07387 [Leishmania martiniquensis]|uniref:peptide-methionine (S)-S-oxide reductase n=1 Tax=Leishmania martiniquensis TaxID=1580590 RepID=A0A836H7J9_9TRYP|nr:hypothetical protein LSCM1_07387 [Leishmania martiniquensis]
MAAPTRATFAAGCYWGTEHYFTRKFKDALLSHQVGFMGGAEGKAVTYSDVSKGNTGHAEVLDITFDPNKVSYEELLSFFFRMHNSTTLNRQAGDVGTNYRSAIFYHSEDQKQQAEEFIAKLNGADEKLHSTFVKAFGGAPCVTTVEKAGSFYAAHAAHQDYLKKNPHGYCAHRLYY